VEAKPAYSSPIRLDFGGSRQLVFLTQQKLLALSTEGEELWSVPFAPKVDIKPAQPVFVPPDLILVSASYGVGAKVVRLKVEAGLVAAEEVWAGQQMRNHFNASVALDGHVYSGLVQSWYLDVESFLVLRKDVEPEDERDLERPRAWLFDDYRPVNGVLLPFWVFVEEPLFSREYLFETIEANVEIDDALFEPLPGAIQTRPGTANRR
jgi:hypothetical protein